MTEPSFRHLEEAELNDLADGTVTSAPDEWTSHLRWCPACRERLEGIKGLLARASRLTSELEGGGGDWATLRARLAPAVAPTPGRFRLKTPLLLAAGVLLAVVGALVTRQRLDRSTGVADSTGTGSRPSKTEQDLLTELELERGLLRPETIEQLEDDLKTINAAAAELEAAIARDPNNPTLRRLLAASDEQKAALLKQLGNAS